MLHIVIMWSFFLASLYFSSLPTPEGTNKMSGTATMKNMEKLCSQKKSFFFLFLSFFLQCDTTGRCTALFVFFIFTCFWISIRKHHRGNLNYSNLHRCLFTAYIIWYLNIKLAQQKNTELKIVFIESYFLLLKSAKLYLQKQYMFVFQYVELLDWMLCLSYEGIYSDIESLKDCSILYTVLLY